MAGTQGTFRKTLTPISIMAALCAMIMLEVTRASAPYLPPSDMEQHLAAEANPIARLLLITATRCNLLDTDTGNDAPMPPCDKCQIWQNLWALPVPELHWHDAGDPANYDAPQVIAWRSARFLTAYASRAPPSFVL